MLPILFIPLFIVVVGGNHAVVGNYSQLNTPLCGLRRVRHSIDSDCLVWHHMETPSLTHARNGTLGDAPWTVLITVITLNEFKWLSCTGTIISSKWILSAAHCFKDELKVNVFRVYFGYNYTYNQVTQLNNYRLVKHYYIHPNYNNVDPSVYDICLLELQTEIPVQTDGDYYVTNSICLPARNVRPTDSEYLLMAGYGIPYTTVNNIPIQFSVRQTIVPNNDNNTFMKHKSINDGLVCIGDSGAGLWQYVDEKAVLIGVHSNSPNKKANNCSVHPNIGNAVQVSKHIDWIINYIH
ncbi:serine protease 28-like [Oppia nitens]|uniref:serine protease 28-like n=1 Tax=Oppia nitens TaxID=1686743 RepID=UPI0023DB3B30|nr:serine protease 28-like [Oppia nitens]